MHHFRKVILKKGKEESLLRYHPWVFSGAIEKIDGPVEEGDVVVVLSSSNQFLGMGHCAIGSIAVRIFSFHEIIPDLNFWTGKLRSALELRKRSSLADQPDLNVFRLVHGEGDNLPGLILDYYDGTVVFQAHTVGMWLIRELLVDALKNVLGDRLRAVYDKSSRTLPFKALVDQEDGYLFGSSSFAQVLEYGNQFLIDWEKGQKTGFFIDQRENRKILGEYAYGKEVLNMFSYTGGFSAYAMKGGAKLVHSVDASAQAIEMTNQNIRLNYKDDYRHEGFVSDAFDFMNEMKDKYDLIVLDPPAFAKHKNVLNQALQGYKRLNLRAFSQIRPGGILFTFSCSQAVSRANFREAVFSAAAISKRNVRILRQLTQPEDHPVNIYHPEGEYLKGLVLYVE